MAIEKKLNRRDFLRGTAIAAVGVMAASCAQPTPIIVEKEVPVEKVVKETVVVEKQVPVEKMVKETVVVSKEIAIEKVVTATPVPPKFFEAPMLAELVKAGKLPPVEDRLPVDPMVIAPVDTIGTYGGTWRMVASGTSDFSGHSSRVNPVEGFITWGMDGASIVPNLASKWEIGDNGASFTFYLRKGVKWSDGKPFTAADVLFLHEDVYKNTELTPNYPGGFKMAGEPAVVEKLDDYTFSIKFAAPYGLFPLNMAADFSGWSEVPAHYMKQFHASYTAKANLDKMVADNKLETWMQLYSAKGNWMNNPEKPLLRPWLMVQPPPETTLILERNPYYWKVDPDGNQLPYIDRQRHTLVESVDVINLRAVAGEIDNQMRNIALASYPLYKENAAKGGYDVYLWKMAETGACFFPNQTLLKDDVLRGIMQDIRFRKALQYAIDTDEVNELHYVGQASDMTSCVPDELKGEKIFEEYTYDVAKANALLDEMGLDKKGPNGWRLRPDGQELSLTVETAASWTTVVPVAELVAGYWQKIGINAVLKSLMYEGWWDRVGTSEYQVIAYLLENFDPLINLTYPRNYFVTSYDCYWGTLWGAWYNAGGKAGEEPPDWVKELQTAYDGVKGETDPAKQIAVMNDAFKVWLESHNIVHTVGRYPQPVIVKTSFKNFPKDGVNGWPLRSPGYSRPEQYFMTA